MLGVRFLGFFGFASGAARRQDGAFGGDSASGRREEARHFEPDAFGVFAFDFLDDFAPIEVALVNDAVNRLQFADVGGRETGAAQTDRVQPDDLTRKTVDGNERGNVANQVRLPADHRERADANELVSARRSGDERAAPDRNVPGEHRVIRHDDFVGDSAVVGDVNVRHQHAVVPDDGRVFEAHRAVNRNVFADDATVADNNAAAIFVAQPDALRETADNRALENMIVFADNDAFFDRNARFENAAVADCRAVFDDAKRADLNVSADFRVRADKR